MMLRLHHIGLVRLALHIPQMNTQWLVCTCYVQERVKRQLEEIDKCAALVQRRIIEVELRCAELREGQEQEVFTKLSKEQRMANLRERKHLLIKGAQHMLKRKAGGGWSCNACRQGAGKSGFLA